VTEAKVAVDVGRETVTGTLAFTPSMTALTTVLPTLIPLTVPSAATVATAGSLDVQLTVRFSRIAPPASRAVAVRRSEPPMTRARVDGAMETAVTAGGDGAVSSPQAEMQRASKHDVMRDL
jgi:hypothetical protein